MPSSPALTRYNALRDQGLSPDAASAKVKREFPDLDTMHPEATGTVTPGAIAPVGVPASEVARLKTTGSMQDRVVAALKAMPEETKRPRLGRETADQVRTQAGWSLPRTVAEQFATGAIENLTPSIAEAAQEGDLDTAARSGVEVSKHANLLGAARVGGLMLGGAPLGAAKEAGAVIGKGAQAASNVLRAAAERAAPMASRLARLAGHAGTSAATMGTLAGEGALVEQQDAKTAAQNVGLQTVLGGAFGAGMAPEARQMASEAAGAVGRVARGALRTVGESVRPSPRTAGAAPFASKRTGAVGQQPEATPMPIVGTGTMMPAEARSTGGRYAYLPEMPADYVPDQALERQHVQTIRAKSLPFLEQLGAKITHTTEGDGMYGGAETPNHIHHFDAGVTDDAARTSAAVLGLIEGQNAQTFARLARSGDNSNSLVAGTVLTGPNHAKLAPETLQAIKARLIETFGKEAAATVDDGHVLILNTPNFGLKEKPFRTLVQRALEGLSSEHEIQPHKGTFYSEYLDGNSAYLRAIGRNADAIRAARAGVASVADDYAAHAERIGADPAIVRQRIAERLASLDALHGEIVSPPPKGNTRGIAGGVAAQQVFTKYQPIEAADLETVAPLMVQRLEETVGELVKAGTITKEMAQDWYKSGTGTQYKIAQLMIPELREEPKRVLQTIINSILSSGQEVPVETRVGTNVMEQYLRTSTPDKPGRITILDPTDPRYGSAYRQQATGGKKGIRGERAKGILGEMIPSSPRTLNHELSLQQLDALVQSKGEQGAVDWLLTNQLPVMKGKQIKNYEPVMTKLFGPKIGRYAMDKLGLPSGGERTIDLWMARMDYMLRGDASSIGADGKLNDNVSPAMRQRMQRVLADFAGKHGMPESSAQALAWYAIKRAFRDAGAKEKIGAYNTLPSAQLEAATVAAPEYVGPIVQGVRGGTKGWRAGVNITQVAKRLGEKGTLRPTEGAFAGQPLGMMQPKIAGALGGGALGATGGAMVGDTPEERRRNALAGLVAGAAAGAGVMPRAAGRELRAFGGPRTGALGPQPPKLPADLVPELGPRFPTRPARAAGEVVTDVPLVDVERPRMFKATDFQLSPEGEQEFAQIMGPVGVKRRVSWDDAKEVANVIGIAPHRILQQTRDLSGEEVLALKGAVSASVKRLELLHKTVADPATPLDAQMAALGEIDRRVDDISAMANRVSGEQSKSGRDLNLAKVMGLNTMDPGIWSIFATKVKGLPLAADEIVQIHKLTGDRDREGLAQLISSLKTLSPWEKAITTWKAGLLTNPKTHLVNFAGNGVMAIMEQAKDAPAVAADMMMSLATGSRTKALPAPSSVASAVREVSTRGVQGARTILRTGMAPEQLEKWDFRNGRFGKTLGSEKVGRFLDLYTQTIFRGLSAGDQLFKAAAIGRSLDEQIRVEAARIAKQSKGTKSPVSAAQAAETLRKNVPAAFEAEAMLDADLATFNSDNALATAVSAGKRALGGGAGLAVAESQMPFVRTPTNVLARTLDYTPAGVLRMVQPIYKMAKGTDIPANQKKVAEAFGRASVGSMMLYLGWELAGQNKATGTMPMGAKDEYDVRGRQAGSVRVGDNWHEVVRMQPGGTLLTLGAELRRIAENAGSASDVVGGSAAAAGKVVSDQPFLQGVTRVTEALQEPANKGGAWVRGVAGSAVPAIVASVAKGGVTQRDPRTVTEAIKARVPGLASSVPAKLDTFGRELPQAGVLGQMFDITRTSPDRETPALAEMRRLGVSLGKPGKTISVEGKTYALSPEEYRTLLKQVGPETERLVNAALVTPFYQQGQRTPELSDLARGEMLQDAVGEARARFQEALAASIYHAEEQGTQHAGTLRTKLRKF